MKIRGLWLRAGVAGLLMVTLFGGLAARVVELQLGDHAELRGSYRRKVSFREKLQGARGRILDRNGRVLALDEARKHVAVDPQFLNRYNDPERVRAVLERFLHVEPAVIGARISNTDSQFAYLEKYVEDRRASELDVYLRENNLRKGVRIDKVNTRTYPHGNLLSHVIGFENHEGVGAAGVELEMDRYLKGKGGIRVSEADANRVEMVSRRRLQIDPQDGADVTLTVDQYLQFGVEQALEEALETYQAKAGWAVVMEVETGAILALASKPDFDLNAFATSSSSERRNRAVATIYEPGSIMKPLVFAAALNEGLVDPDEMIDCEYGVWIHRNRPLRDFHPYAELSAADVLKKSSNIGSAKIALRLTPDQMYDYLRAYGFGSRTGLDLPGEQAGISHPPRVWDSLTHSRVAIGHAIGVTAMQMAVAMNVLANDGERVEPFLVREVRANDGTLLYKRPVRTPGERVVRRDTARKMRKLLARITESGGTGRRSRFGDYVVAGKTGTAEKIREDGGYHRNKNIASFSGFFPADNPALTIVVSIDEPSGAKRTGGVVAAPVFRQIAEYAAGYLAIPPEGF